MSQQNYTYLGGEIDYSKNIKKYGSKRQNIDYLPTTASQGVYRDGSRTPNLVIPNGDGLTPANDNKYYKNMEEYGIKGILSPTDLSKLFFSNDNQKRIQKMIRKAVTIKTKGKFKLDDDQDENDLLIVMRAIYQEKATFDSDQIVRQVKRLNDETVKYLLPDLLSNIKQDYGYLQELNKPITPIMRPMNVNKAGRRALPSVFTTFL